MVSRTRWWAAGLAAAGLMALPANSTAQGTTGSSPSQSYGQSSTENKSPRYHLDQAKRVLDELSRSSDVSGSQTGSTTTGSGTTGSGTTGSGTTGSGTTGSGTTGSGTTGSQSGSTMAGATDTASVVSELRRHFTLLEQAYERSRRGTSSTGTTGSGTTGSGTTGSGTTGSESQSSATSESWMTHYSRLNQVLDRVNVPKTSTAMGTSGSTSGTGTSGSTSGTGSGTTGSGTTGSGTTGSGTTGSGSTSGGMSQSGSSSIDPATMSRLQEFRMHIDNFHAAAMAEASGRR